MTTARLAAAAAAATGIQVGAAMVATRFVIAETDPVTLALLRYIIGFACLVPPLLLAPRPKIAGRDLLPIALLAGANGLFAAPPHLSIGGWLAVGFIGLSSGIGYYLWLWALAHASPTRVTVFLALSPITALLLGGLLLGEPISAAALAGTAAVMLGLWVAHR